MAREAGGCRAPRRHRRADRHRQGGGRGRDLRRRGGGGAPGLAGDQGARRHLAGATARAGRRPRSDAAECRSARAALAAGRYAPEGRRSPARAGRPPAPRLAPRAQGGRRAGRRSRQRARHRRRRRHHACRRRARERLRDRNRARSGARPARGCRRRRHACGRARARDAQDHRGGDGAIEAGDPALLPRHAHRPLSRAELARGRESAAPGDGTPAPGGAPRQGHRARAARGSGAEWQLRGRRLPARASRSTWASRCPCGRRASSPPPSTTRIACPSAS